MVLRNVMRRTARANMRTIPTTSSGWTKRFSDRAELVSQPALRVQNGNTTRKLLHRYLRKRRYSFFLVSAAVPRVYYANVCYLFLSLFLSFFLFSSTESEWCVPMQIERRNQAPEVDAAAARMSACHTHAEVTAFTYDDVNSRSRPFWNEIAPSSRFAANLTPVVSSWRPFPSRDGLAPSAPVHRNSATRRWRITSMPQSPAISILSESH